MPFKLLSDFDGVWTDQALEAEHVKLFVIAEAARLAGVPADVASAEFDHIEAGLRAAPLQHGWAPDGRLTAYVDEDPFCVPNALCSYVARAAAGDPARRYREAIEGSGYADLNAFADACFHGAMRDFRDRHPPALLPHARRVVDALHELGVEIVVVSNSPSDKIAHWFTEAGVDAGTEPGRAIRVRGQAGKQTLGPTDESLELGGRRVFVDRPLYRRIVLEENPTAVIGDVLSLDLALPYLMRDEGVPEAPELLVLRRHTHTPAWSLGLAAEGVIDQVVDDPEQLVGLVQSRA